MVAGPPESGALRAEQAARSRLLYCGSAISARCGSIEHGGDLRDVRHKLSRFGYRLLSRLPGWKGILAVFAALLLVAWLVALVALYANHPPPPRGDGGYLFGILSAAALRMLAPGGAHFDAVTPALRAAVEGLFWSGLAWLGAAGALGRFRRRLAARLAGAVRGHVLVFGTGGAVRDMLDVNRAANTPQFGLLPERDLALQSGLDQRRVPWIPDDATPGVLARTLSCPGASIVAADDSDTSNIAFVERLARMLSRVPVAADVSLIVRIADGRLRRQLSERFTARPELSGLRVILFSDHDLRARLAARLVPAFRFVHAAQPDLAHLVIVGRGYPAEIMLVHLLKTMHFPGAKRVVYSVVDRDATELRADFDSRFAQLAGASAVDFRPLDTTSASDWAGWLLNQAEAGRRPTGWYFIDEGRSAGLKQALAVEDAYLAVGEIIPPLVLLSAEAPAAGSAILADSPMLTAVGNVNRVENGDLVSQRQLDTMAAAIQERYLEKCLAAGERLGERPALSPWPELAENFKDENRDQAEHNLLKLGLLSLAPAAGPATGELAVPDAALEALSIAEHERWLASRRARNWTFAEQRDDHRRQHPDMVSWEDLPESRREIDRIMIRNLGRLLRRMGQAAKKRAYCLVRAEPGAGDAALRSAIEACGAVLRDEFPDRQPVLVGHPAEALTRLWLERFPEHGFVARLTAPADVRPLGARDGAALARLVAQARGYLAAAGDAEPDGLRRLVPDIVQEWLEFRLRADGRSSCERRVFDASAGREAT